LAQQNRRDNETYLVLAETRALRYMMQFPARRHEFRPSMFIHKTARILYESIHELLGENATVDASSIAQAANKKDSKLSLPEIKNLLFSGQEDYTFNEGDLEILKRDLSASETRARIYKKVEETLEFMAQPSVPDQKYFDKVSKGLVEAQTEAMNRSGSPLITMSEALERYDKELTERAAGKIAASGDLLLDRALVRKTAGGQIILIAGSTGSGKSLYMLNLMNGFIDLGIPAIYITLEMDMISTIDRLAALRTKTPIQDWYDAEKLVNLRRKLKPEVEYLSNNGMVEIVEDPSLSLADINAIIGEYRSKHQIPWEQRIIVGIDLVTMVKDFMQGQKGYSLANNYEAAANQQNAIAKMQNVCFIDTAQFNRNADTVDIQEVADLRKTRPTLNDVKNSAALGERARAVLSVWRPYYYALRYLPGTEETEAMEDIMYAQVLKQNQGEVGQELAYRFHGEYGEILPVYDESLGSNNLIGESDVDPSATDRLMDEVSF